MLNLYVRRAITDDQSYFLRPTAFRNPGNGFAGEHPRHDGGVVAISPAADQSVLLIFRKKIMEGVSRGGVKG